VPPGTTPLSASALAVSSVRVTFLPFELPPRARGEARRAAGEKEAGPKESTRVQPLAAPTPGDRHLFQRPLTSLAASILSTGKNRPEQRVRKSAFGLLLLPLLRPVSSRSLTSRRSRLLAPDGRPQLGPAPRVGRRLPVGRLRSDHHHPVHQLGRLDLDAAGNHPGKNAFDLPC